MNPMPATDRVLVALFDSPATADVVAQRAGLADALDARLSLLTLLISGHVTHDDRDVWSLTDRGRLVAAGVELYQRRVVMGT